MRFSRGIFPRFLDTHGLPFLESKARAFGRDYLEKLYVTTGIHKTEVKNLAGRVIEIPDVGVRGVESYPHTG